MSGLAGQRIARLQAELAEARAAAASAAQTVQEVQQQLAAQGDTAAKELDRVRDEAASSVRQTAEHSAKQLDDAWCAPDLVSTRDDNLSTTSSLMVALSVQC